MEKVISINFQGRVIPIEETAYNALKQYIDSLRSHFAAEESSDEIINDIENRIAELFTDKLKHGARCIVSSDVSSVIDSIGRLEDIEAAEGEDEKPKPANNNARSVNPPPSPTGRFYRNADDKVIAGVCSGIANRTGMDPVGVRILFVLLFGAFFWVYILLWIIVPSQSVQSNITKRLYRNPDDKVIAGVCGGLAAYFKMDSRNVRLIFAIPLLVGVLTRGQWLWWHHGSFSWGFGPHFFFGSISSALLLGYIILWIALPYATSTSEVLEMRGQKVDLNSIKATSQARANAGAPPVRHRSGLGHVIGIIFKAFFLLIAGSIALGLFAALIGILFGGVALMPFTSFFLDDWGQHVLVWAGLILFLSIPFLALVTWGIRRMTGVRSRRHYLGYIFAGLWIIGLVCTLILTGMLASDFSTRYVQDEQVAVTQPSNGKLYINVSNVSEPWSGHHHSRWLRNWDDEDSPFRLINGDSMWLNTVKVKVAQSEDSLFHIYRENISRGSSPEQARNLASHINFNIAQQDSVITLPRGFNISSKDKFRNQQVLVVIEVPLGKSIKVDKDVRRYDWFNVDIHRSGHVSVIREWSDGYRYRGNRDYIMTASGLQNANDSTIVKDYSDDDDNDDE